MSYFTDIAQFMIFIMYIVNSIQ